MDHHLDSRPLRIFLEGDAGEREIDLTKVAPADLFQNDLIRYRVTGTVPPGSDFSVANFIGCELYDFTAEGIEFSDCDFKDTLIKGTVFSDCSFNGGTFATTFISETEFRRCTFYNNAAYGCDFRGVHFVDCDLTNLLVKSSRFSQCTFENCVTSNKICEMSTLFGVAFVNTPIQIETITDNFGLTSADLRSAPIRSARVREPYRTFSDNDIKALLKSQKLSGLEKLTLEYFLTHTLVNGSALLDESLNIARWTRIYRNPGSFVELLDKFAEFLLHLYDDNKLTAHPILLLHHITSTLSETLPSEEELHRVAMSLGGVHLILSRVVEAYLRVLDLITQRTAGSVAFLAEGPTDPDYFRKELEPWLGAEGVEITRLERNSPLFIEFSAPDLVSLLPIIAIFLATRVKLDISRLKKALEEEKGPGTGKKGSKKSKRNLPARIDKSLQQRKKESERSLFSVSTGWVAAPNPAYELRVRSLMPGSLLVDLKLNVNTTVAHRLRSILQVLLTDSTGKRS
jgi:uncharacterized protein YjbI with pentapeptide repeats